MNKKQVSYPSQDNWKPIRIKAAIKEMIAAAALNTGTPEYIVFNILLTKGGFKDGMTIADIEQLVSKAAQDALATLHGG